MKARNIHLASIPVILTSAILLASVTSVGLPVAEAAETYHGTITGGTFFCNGIQVVGPTVTGIWNLNIDANTPAQVTLNAFYNGSHSEHVQTNTLTQVSFVNGVYVFSSFRGMVTATLDTTTNPPAFAWHVVLNVSCPSQHPYNSLTWSGVADRG